MLGLELKPHGGAVLEALARRGDAARFPLPVPMKRHANCDFSFAGLKTGVRLCIEKELPPPGAPGARQGAGSSHFQPEPRRLHAPCPALRPRPPCRPASPLQPPNTTSAPPPAPAFLFSRPRAGGRGHCSVVPVCGGDAPLPARAARHRLGARCARRRGGRCSGCWRRRRQRGSRCGQRGAAAPGGRRRRRGQPGHPRRACGARGGGGAAARRAAAAVVHR
jgi:hypothetical protein